MVRLLGREVAGEGEGDPRRSEASGLEAEPLQMGAELRGVQEQQGLEEVQQRQQGAWLRRYAVQLAPVAHLLRVRVGIRARVEERDEGRPRVLGQ